MFLLPIGLNCQIEDINWLDKSDLSKNAIALSSLIRNAKAQLERDGIEDSIWVNFIVKF